ncbi:MAG: hypothetical protein K6G47_00190 [Clostridia bacterium]|nr:hypothetical protein [Clostridia bacterium]
MGKGETDWELMDAYEIQMRTIPSLVRFTNKRKTVVGIILLAVIIAFLTCLFMMARVEYTLTQHLIASVMCVFWAIILMFMLAWFIIGVVLERQAYSKACRMAMEHDIWEREKFREEYQKTIKDHNYKN